MFDDSGFTDSLFNSALNNRFMNMVTPLFTRLCVFPSVFLGEYSLPFSRCVRVFPIKGVRHRHQPFIAGWRTW